MSRQSKAVLTGLVTVVVALAALLYVRRFAVPTGKVEPAPSTHREPEPPAPVKFAAPTMSPAERREFLNADYTIVRKVADLPVGIRKLYAAKGESRAAIADPGEQFQVTDVVMEPDLPWRRLIFAGVARGRAFLHYELGGIAHSYIVEFFQMESPDSAIGLWRGYCGPVKSLDEMKQLVLKNDAGSCWTAAPPQSNSAVKWQSVDQLCGRLRFANPKKKTMTTVDGKVETRFYPSVLKDADVELYNADVELYDLTGYKNCCDGRPAAGRTKSDKVGGFELPGFPSGWYWLHIESNDFSATIPLHVTSDSDNKSCHERSVGRIFTVDTQPPKVETRIY